MQFVSIAHSRKPLLQLPQSVMDAITRYVSIAHSRKPLLQRSPPAASLGNQEGFNRPLAKTPAATSCLPDQATIGAMFQSPTRENPCCNWLVMESV